MGINTLTFIENPNKKDQYRLNVQNDRLFNEDDEFGVSDLIGGGIVPREEIDKAPILKIKVVEGPEHTKNKSLEINACGLVGSKRNKNDGCTIIGSLGQRDNGDYLNDFVIAQDDLGIGKRHLIIKYSIDDSHYYIRDLGDGSGTFVKLEQKLQLKNGYIVSFGDSHMTVNFFSSSERMNGSRKIKKDQI